MSGFAQGQAEGACICTFLHSSAATWSLIFGRGWTYGTFQGHFDKMMVHRSDMA